MAITRQTKSNPVNLYTLYWKTIKERKWKRVVSMQGQESLIKDAYKYKSQIAEDNNIYSGTILLLITENDKRIIWSDLNYSDEQIKNFNDIGEWTKQQLQYFFTEGKNNVNDTRRKRTC